MTDRTCWTTCNRSTFCCSYGLMQQENKQFFWKTFYHHRPRRGTSHQNRSTKRSQAAMQLQADFRIITTGTPIENHLGELWNLFNFLNPGLLGSLNISTTCMPFPLSAFRDRERRNQLKRLIQPFILRRRKSEVLDELPAKNRGHPHRRTLQRRAGLFYEALRRKVVKNIENSTGETGDKTIPDTRRTHAAAPSLLPPLHARTIQQIESSKLNFWPKRSRS
ncbi:MAG: SNF2-related protein [Saprospiraceae bacterium]